MATRIDPLERKYYPVIRNFLKTKGFLTHGYEADGSRFDFVSRGQGQLLIDVYGLKGNPDDRVQSLQGVAVEVKRKSTNTSLRYIAQAESYSILAHLCYLAQPLDFTDKTKAEAARVGVGLLRIRGGKVEIVAESRLFQPNPDSFSRFVNHSLRISQCSVCGCYRHRYGKGGEKDGIGGGHWRRDDTILDKSGKSKLIFVCEDCEEHWARAGQFKKLEDKVARLENRLSHLQASHRKLKSKV